MKIVVRLALVLSGLFSLTAFFTSLTKAWSLNVTSLDGRETLNYHFSLYLPDNRNSFFTGIIEGAERAASELHAAISIHSIDPAKNEFEMASYTGVDGVIVCPYLDDSLARRQLEKLDSRRIPVVLVNHNITNDQPWPFIGTNNFDMGRRIGLISMRLKPVSGNPEPLRLAVVYSDKAPGIYAERELVEMGMASALGDTLDPFVMSFKTNLNPLDAEALLYRLFRDQPEKPEEESPDINTIVFTDSSDTLAAAQTLVDMNLVGRVQVIGFGADPGVLENIRKGIVACSVVIDSEKIGYEAVRSLTALRTTGYTSATIDTGIEIITGSGL
ncbi:MAG: substrate-binding domain-containing protein [Treponema sp.]|nr:substrate-binding domain-containing protein [Treponema sp.]